MKHCQQSGGVLKEHPRAGQNLRFLETAFAGDKISGPTHPVEISPLGVPDIRRCGNDRLSHCPYLTEALHTLKVGTGIRPSRVSKSVIQPATSTIHEDFSSVGRSLYEFFCRKPYCPCSLVGVESTAINSGTCCWITGGGICPPLAPA
jgi:hypothetical protein